ncbi:MAG: zinc dependent phospholipase C family protein [Candidatus Thorarchaeota archaeon]
MKHKKALIFLGFIIFLLSVGFWSPALAWANGSYISTLEPQHQYNMCAYYATRVPPYEDPIDCYTRFYQAQDSAFYSTHDFIPHFALDYLCASDPSGKYYWLRDPNQRYFYIFLLGTEFPDYTARKSPAPLSLDTIADVGALVQKGHTNEQAMSAARKMSYRAVEYLKKPNYKRASPAFFLGALTHYIADLSFPPHIYRPYDKYFRPWMNDQVSDKTIIEDYYQNGMNRFFYINLEEILGYTPVCLNIYDLFTIDPNEKYGEVIYFIAEMMRFTTLLNLEVKFNLQVEDGSWNVNKLHDFFISHGEFEFAEVGRHNVEYVEFFDRIEELLNWAVYWTAAALKICLDLAEEKEDDPDKKPPRPVPDDDERDYPYDAVDFLARYGAMIAALAAMGILSNKLLGRFKP